MSNAKFIYQCCDCGKQYESSPELYLCPTCSAANNPTTPPKGVFKTVYDYKSINPKTLTASNYIDLLPLKFIDSLPPLRVGKTPLYSFTSIDGEKLPFNLLLKDDSQNPTFSFKDRASVVVSAYAKEKGIDTIVAASTGNAGSSLAGICASQGQKAIIMVPKAAPLAKLTQIVMYGAKIVPVDGTYDNAFDLSIEATKEFGWYNRNTAFNPLTIEGKKTVSFELFDQLNGKTPDTVFVPVGDGVIISGVYKGFEDLLMLGLIDKMPTIVAVQSAG
ncbi:MAG TPA: pyridoxal-phosphate dependent enzyme, partial [Tenuifilaceae bacterium]|nr:pyridoxal-phosphate dependent enzyme [Tenuifilaceae bacterium]